MKRLRISQIQFEAKPTPLENAEILKRYFERTKKFNPNLICTPECSNIITNDLNFLKNNTTFEKIAQYCTWQNYTQKKIR